MSHTDRSEPPRPHAKESRANRRRWIRRSRAQGRRALRRDDYDAASRRPRRTQGWLTW